MNRRLWISLALLTVLAGCSSAGDTGNNPQNFSGNSAQVLFDPLAISGQAVIPFPFDGLFAGFSSPTLNIPAADAANPSDPANALTNAANMTDGFSTTASLFIDVTGQLDYSTVLPHLLIINTKTMTPLTPGTDFVVQNSLATATDLASNTQTPIATQRSRILILLKHPLQPGTTYLAALTSGVKTVQGAGVTASDEFKITASATPVDQQTGAAVDGLSPTQKATLEALRSQLIYPAVAALNTASVPPSSLLLAWTFTTESIGDTLKLIAANPPSSAIGVQVADTGITTQQALASSGAQSPGYAEVYAGVTQVPYYLNVASGPHDPSPLSGYWHADPTKPSSGVFALTQTAPSSQQIPCTYFAAGATLPDGQTLKPSASTTACFPSLDQSTATTQTIPVLMTVPDSASGQTMPANGWPVVIFQHGITRNRTDMLAVADGLSKAGFVVVAIDLPLHGITDNTNPFYDNQLFTGTPAAALETGERTFDLDLENNSTSAPGPDGKIDGSGTYFINLTSLITSRDNNRQAVSDLLTLANTLKTAGAISVNTSSGPTPLKIDPTRIAYFGHSLGAIVGSTLMGVDAGSSNGGLIGPAVLANPGGGEAKLLDASGTFGPIISAGLAANGVQQGSDDYETFLRFAQQLIDPADPINWAAAAGTQHDIDMIEVIGDAVVPNSSAPSTCPANLSLASITSPGQLATQCPSVPLIESGTQATDPSSGALIFQQDVTIEPSYLGGTDPLWAAMGLNQLGPLTPAAGSVTPTGTLGDYTGGHYVVQFQADGARHGSVLDPSTNPYVTGEMQCEAALFLATGGAHLAPGCSVAQ